MTDDVLIGRRVIETRGHSTTPDPTRMAEHGHERKFGAEIVPT